MHLHSTPLEKPWLTETPYASLPSPLDLLETLEVFQAHPGLLPLFVADVRQALLTSTAAPT